MKAFRVLIRETREGFRLLVAWFIGFISFGLLCELTVGVVSYLQPWKSGRTAYDEAELLLLSSAVGVGLVAIAGTLVFEGLKRRPSFE